MPTPAIALKLKRFRRRFGITAPRVVVRSHFSWRWYALAGALSLALVVACVWVLFQRGEVKSLDHELEELRQAFLVQQEALIKLRSTAGTEQNLVRMERSTQQSLVTRIQGLERENSQLKEDMRLFERLIPVEGEAGQVRIENFRLVPEAEGRYRYRLLLAFQSGKQMPEFRGRLQLLATFLLEGKEKTLALPAGYDANPEYVIDLKHLLRREGVFGLPSGARLKAIEARVFQGDSLKAKRVVQL